MIQSVSNITFQSKFGRYSSHTPKMRPYREFEFMPELQKQNPIKEFIKATNKTAKKTYNAIFVKLVKLFSGINLK